jgi:hypothetical protein
MNLLSEARSWLQTRRRNNRATRQGRRPTPNLLRPQLRGNWLEARTLLSLNFGLNFAAATPGTYNQTTGVGGAFGDGTKTNVVSSLDFTQDNFRVGDHVIFFLQVNDTDPVGSVDTLVVQFQTLADSTGQSGVALKPVNVTLNTPGDTGNSPNPPDAATTVTASGPDLSGTEFTKGSTYAETATVSHLDGGATVILRLDTVIEAEPNPSPTGNLQASLQSATLTQSSTQTTPASVSGGAQTINLKNVQNITVPSLLTTPGGTIALGSGQALTDSATISGNNPMGTITFQLYAPDGKTVVYTDSGVTVSGNGTYTTSSPGGSSLGGWVPTGTGTVTGTYNWVVTYSGDGMNTMAVSPLGAEPENVIAASPTLVTTASSAITLQDETAPTITDSADLEGAYNPTGTLAFSLTLNGMAVPGTISGASQTVTHNGTYTASYTLPTTGTVVGTYLWHVVYTSGSDNNNNGTDDTQSTSSKESTVVSAASPTLVTTASSAITLKDEAAPTITDSADLEGAYNPTGTLTFTLTLNGMAVPGTITHASQTVTQNGTYTASYTLPTTGTVVGTYLWHVVYTSGPDNNNNGTDDTKSTGSKESTAISAASPTLVTTASSAITLGTTDPTISDTADLEGAYNPTGTLAFTLTLNGMAVPGTITHASQTVTGNGTYTASYTLPTTGTVVGTYLWHVVYTSGPDNNNNGTDDTKSTGSKESTVVSAASPTLVTTASGTITLGTTAPTISDTADLEGAYNPTGTLAFTLTLNGMAVPGTITHASQTVTGNGTYTASYTLPTTGTVVGTYLWHVVYTSGSDNNNDGTDDTKSTSSKESTAVSTADPSFSTTPGSAMLMGSGMALTDSATLAGYSPAGTITFQLYAPDGKTVVYTDSGVTVSGNGTYTTSSPGGSSLGGWVPPATAAMGTYNWVVTYSGDGNNQKVVSSSGNEPEALLPPASLIEPTGTTCMQFVSDLANPNHPLSASLPYLSVTKKSASSHAISNVTPGVFFLYVKITAPSMGTFTIDVMQNINPALMAVSGSSTLFHVLNDSANQVVLYDANCNVSKQEGTVNLSNLADLKVQVKNATANQVFYLSLKFDPKSIANSIFPGNGPNNGLDTTARFTTLIGANTVALSNLTLHDPPRGVHGRSAAVGRTHVVPSNPPLPIAAGDAVLGDLSDFLTAMIRRARAWKPN